MVEIEITDNLIGSLSETYFKEFCDQHGWAYTSLEQIHENKIKDNVLKFKKGFHRISIYLPDEIVKEIEGISKPSNSSKQNPSYVYDFLICKVGQKSPDSKIRKMKNYKSFRWAEIKTGYNKLSKRQISTLEKITIPLYRYRVPWPSLEIVDVYDDKVNSEFLYYEGEDYKINKISMKHDSLKEIKFSFKKITPEKFLEIKQGLEKLFKVVSYQSNDPNISESFNLVSFGTNFPISYYKKGTLLIQGDKSLEGFNLISKIIQITLENDSKE